MKKTIALIITGVVIVNNPSWAKEGDPQKVNARVSSTVNFGEEKARPITTGKTEIAPGFQDSSANDLQGLNPNEFSEKNIEQVDGPARRVPKF